MQDIELHERRLVAALLRIGAAAERLTDPPPAGNLAGAPETDTAAEVEIARLHRLLDQEHARSVELAEQLAAARDRHEATAATLEARIQALTGQLDEQGAEVERLRLDLARAREGDPGCTRAELEALRAARAADAAELDRLIGALEALVAGAGGVVQQEGNDARD